MNVLNQSIIKHKMGLLNLADELRNVSQACRVMGVSRDTFYRVKEAKESGGLEALLHKDRRRSNLKNRVDEAVEQAVLAFALDNPAAGQVRVSNELRKQGMFVSPTGVRSVWLRHDLQTFKRRLAALEKKSAEEGLVLTERQIAALERKREEQLECGEIETAHPGYLGSQDTFYVGNMKGVGRIYQQTFVDTYAKVAFAKLYTTKTPIAAADLLNDRVLPFYQEHQVSLLRVLTDRGTEYCGKVEQHDYQLYLALNDIDHTRTKAQSPQTNGICERFHKTILNEFYQVAFRKKIYTTIESMQEDLDAWIDSYNSSSYCLTSLCR
jgi:transposase InsO family protein